MFKLYFESVYTHLCNSTICILCFNSEINFNIGSCVFTEAEIFQYLRILSNDYNSDSDLIPEAINRNCLYT